jgi:Isocitrate dehydrogenases
MAYKDVAPPGGEKITRTDRLNVPDQPIIPFIRGDGTGPDIWAASVRVFDAAVEKAYGGRKENRVVRSFRRSNGEGQIR